VNGTYYHISQYWGDPFVWSLANSFGVSTITHPKRLTVLPIRQGFAIVNLRVFLAVTVIADFLILMLVTAGIVTTKFGSMAIVAISICLEGFYL